MACREDVPALVAIVGRVVPEMRKAGNLQWGAGYPNAEVLERDIEKDQLWVIESEGQICAFAAITQEQEPEYATAGMDITEDAIVVHRLAVEPASRGRGFAKALMSHAETIARGNEICVLRVDTNTENAATQALFPKLGFSLVGEIELSFRPGLRFWCYEKRLP